jgi:hypothetical protein
MKSGRIENIHIYSLLSINFSSTPMSTRIHISLFACLAAAVFFSVSALDATAQTWANMPGKVVEIAAGGDSTAAVWGLSPDGVAYRWNESKFSWENFGGKADRITVATDGTPWVLEGQQVYRLRGRNWQNMPGKAKAIAAGGNSVWVVGQDNAVYKWNEDAFEWQNRGGDAETIAVTSDGQPWVVKDRKVYRLRGQTWQNMPGKAKEIAAGGGTVWCIGEDDTVYKWNEDSFSWQNFGGDADKIAVAADGTPWVVGKGDSGKQVYRLK